MRRGPGHAHLQGGVVSGGLHSSTFQLNLSVFFVTDPDPTHRDRVSYKTC